MKNHETTLKNMETNQKPWKTMTPAWKTMETNQKPWNHHETLWKPTKNHEITLKNQGGRAGITEKRYLRGVTTDLWDRGGGQGRNNGKTLLTRGHNWPFRGLDFANETNGDSYLFVIGIQDPSSQVKDDELQGDMLRRTLSGFG